MKFFEVTVEVVIATLKNGKDKKAKEIYLVDAQSVTEAESTAAVPRNERVTTADVAVAVSAVV